MSKETGKPKASNIVVWAILGLLILALGGFGVGQFGGSLQTLATVGSREVSVNDYARAIQNEQRAMSQRTGQALTLQQMQLFGMDRQILEGLLTRAALEHEASEMGVSIGDQEVATRILGTQAFQGMTGQFDREVYAQSLRQNGLNESRYEDQVRADGAREILQAAVIGGIPVPEVFTDTIVTWLAETRDATFAEVTVAALPTGPVAPSPEDMQQFYDDNLDRFAVPETRQITYAWVTPDALADTVEVSEERVLELYEARADIFRQPARVLAERLAFADQAAADAALAALEAGETTFDALVTDRGLTLVDVDMGEIARDDVDGPIGDALFALEEPGIAGPVETSLGPTLYRVNAVLDATEVPLDEVRDDLTRTARQDTARRLIDGSREAIDDLLAGGATLEEIAAETEMELGSIALRPGETDGIAAYEAFRTAALAVTDDDFPELEGLADGGLFALRLDEIVPPATPPLEEIRAEVEAAWQAESTADRLEAQAESLAATLRDGDTFEALGLAPEALEALERNGTVEGVPSLVVDLIFGAEAGDVFALRGDATRAFVVRLDAITPPDGDDGDTASLRQTLESTLRNEISTDVFNAYGRAVQEAAGFSVDRNVLNAIHVQLGGGAPGAHGGM